MVNPQLLQVATRNGEPAPIDAGDLDLLDAVLDGHVLLPDDLGFEEATLIWNGMIEKEPALVVQPETTEDVVEAIGFAREHDLLLSIKGGGHNIAGTALADGGLTLDMARMDHVEVDAGARTVRVGPGCLLQDVDRETQKHGLATVLGFVSETGVAGLTLGGGFGYLARRFGWTVDNLVEVEIVTVDGEVLRASREEHTDLFWALRGGGGNFGVVTEFVFRLHEVGPEIIGGLRAWPAETHEQALAALEAYRDLTRDAPRELALFCILRRAPPAPFVPEPWQGRRVAAFLVCHAGDLARAEDDLAPLTQALGEPVFDIVKPRPYTEQQQMLDETQPKGMHYYWKTSWVSELDDGLLEVLCDLSLENPMPMAMLSLLHVGGALNEHDEDDGAVGNRDARYACGATGMWEPGDSDGADHQAWVRAAWQAFEPFSTGGVYVNFLGHDDGEERIQDAYGKNLARLAEVKARYDPGNLLQVNKNIRPTTGGDGR